jgi:cell division protein FtsB
MGKRYSFATFVWIFIILLAAGAALYWLLPIKKELHSKQNELQEAKDKLHQLRKEQNAMEQKNHALKTSPAAVEKVAREELGLVKPHERIFIDVSK